MEYKLSAAGIELAASRIATSIHKTPIFTSDTLNDYVASLTNTGKGPKLYFKCENLQKTGSFKCRGASNAVAKLLSGPENDRIKGFVTHSSGNHGQALAFAAKKFQTQCVVVVPSNAPKAKVQAIEGYGAKIILVEPTMEARKGKCNELSQKEGLQIVDPHDDW
uniref:Tryptophan synthase beta chain-like PALP domain-containing protein n=1 Tax=Panagrolaimus sp. ES5 TaxID=591445 RepID=A0AC34FE28_9BILA